MTYRAGDIESRLTLDRSQFTRELRAARAEADAFSRNPIKLRVDLDEASIARARAQLAALRREMGNSSGPGSLGGAARQGRQQVEQEFNLIRHAIEQLGPPLIPLAGGLLGISSAVVGLGPAAVLAFKGLSEGVKDGSRLGVRLHGDLTVLGTDLKQIQQTAARGVFSGFEQSVSKVHGEMPAFNVEMAQSSKILGDIVSHLTGGLIGGFTTFAPLIHTAEVDLDQLAARFEKWATGPGGAHFAEVLAADIKLVGQFLGAAIPLATDLVSAFAPVGGVMLQDLTFLLRALDGVVHILNIVPHGAEAVAAAYIAMRTAALVAALANKALAASEEEVAAAGAGAAGASGLSRFAPVVGRIGAVAAAAYIGSTFLDNESKGWQQSSNNFKFVVGNTLHGLHDFITGHWSGIFHDTQANDDARKFFEYQKDLFKQYGPGGSLLGEFSSNTGVVQQQAKSVLPAGGTLGITPLVPYYTELTNAQRENRLESERDRATNKAIAQSFASIGIELNRQPIDQASQGYAQLANNLQKQVDTNAKWLDQGGKSIGVIHGMTIGQTTWNAALAASNDDAVAATALIYSRVDALGKEKAAVADASARQQRLDEAVGAATTKYKLTTDQVSLYAQALGISADAVARGDMSTDQFVAKIGSVTHALQNANPVLTAWINAVNTYDQSAKTAADRAQLLGAALVSFNGPAIGYANTMVQASVANQQLVNDLAATGKGIINLKTGFIDWHNAGAAPVLGDLAQLQQTAMQAAAATYQLEVSHKGSKKAAADAADVYRNDTTKALEDEFQQLGKTKTEADKLAERYFHWPKDAKTQIEALGGQSTNDLLDAIGQQLSYLTGQPWEVGVSVNIQTTGSDILSQLSAAGAGVGDTVVVNGKKYKWEGPGLTPVTPAAGYFIDAYAGGGIRENHVAQLAKAGAWRVWAEPETGGEAYIPLAADWRRPRAKEITKEVANKLGGVAFFASGGSGPGGYSGVTYPSGPGNTSGTSTGSTSSTAASTAANQVIQMWQQLLQTLKQALSGLDSFVHPVNALTSAFRQLDDAMRAIEKKTPGSEDRLNRRLHDEQEALRRDLAARDKYRAALSNWRSRLASDEQSLRQYRTGVRDTYLGQFDIGTSGQGYAAGIKYDLEKALADTQREQALITRAKQLGLDPRLIQQFESEGSQGLANLQAVVSGGRSYVHTINDDYAKLVAASSRIAATAAKDNVSINRAIKHDSAEIAENTRKLHRAQERTNHDLDAIHATVRKIEREVRDVLVAARKK